MVVEQLGKGQKRYFFPQNTKQKKLSFRYFYKHYYQPSKQGLMEDKLVTFKNYESMVDAMFEQELLRENNIDCSINNEDSVDLLPMFGELNDGLRIVVLEKDLEKARKVIEDYYNQLELDSPVI